MRRNFKWSRKFDKGRGFLRSKLWTPVVSPQGTTAQGHGKRRTQRVFDFSSASNDQLDVRTLKLGIEFPVGHN